MLSCQIGMSLMSLCTDMVKLDRVRVQFLFEDTLPFVNLLSLSVSISADVSHSLIYFLDSRPITLDLALKEYIDVRDAIDMKLDAFEPLLVNVGRRCSVSRRTNILYSQPYRG